MTSKSVNELGKTTTKESGSEVLSAATRAEELRAGAGTRIAGLRVATFACVVAAIACSGALLLILQSQLMLYGDDWEILLQRRGFSAGVFLDPHLDHIAIAPVAIYKALLAVFGMRSALPFEVVSTLVFLLSVVLLFVYLRRRVGDWPALLGSILILFLGAAWSDLLWSFQIGFFGSVAAGLGALLALERDDRKGDLFACALLVLAISFSELGVPFAVGALASVALGPSPRRGRFYVPLLPLALYGLWYLGWGQNSDVYHYDRFHNLLNSPSFVFDAISENLASLFGLATPLNGRADVNLIGLTWGRILFVIAIPLAIWRLRRVGWRSRGLWVALAAGAAFWFLAALSAIPVLREPTASRYQYPGAIFVLLIAAELLRGVRVDRRLLAAATVVTVLAATSGVIYLHNGYKWRKVVSDLVQTQLGALEIARGHVSGNFVINPNGLFGVNERSRPTTARDYFSAVDAFGSPAFSESQLAAARYQGVADQLLARAEGINLLPVPPAVARRVRAQRCRTLDADPSGLTTLPLAPGDYSLRSRTAPGASLEVARFVYKPWVSLGFVHRGAPALVSIPSDHSTRAWRLSSLDPSAVTVCTVTGSAARSSGRRLSRQASGSFAAPSAGGASASAVAACFKAAGVSVSGPQSAGPGTAVYVFTRSQSPRVATEGFVKAPNTTIAAQLRRTFAAAGNHIKTLRNDPAAFGFYRGTLTTYDSALLSKCAT
jgi:hypothetical protein